MIAGYTKGINIYIYILQTLTIEASSKWQKQRWLEIPQISKPVCHQQIEYEQLGEIHQKQSAKSDVFLLIFSHFWNTVASWWICKTSHYPPVDIYIYISFRVVQESHMVSQVPESFPDRYSIPFQAKPLVSRSRILKLMLTEKIGRISWGKNIVVPRSSFAQS